MKEDLWGSSIPRKWLERWKFRAQGAWASWEVEQNKRNKFPLVEVVLFFLSANPDFTRQIMFTLMYPYLPTQILTLLLLFLLGANDHTVIRVTVLGTNTLCYDTEHHVSNESPGEAVCNSIVMLFIYKPHAHFQWLRKLPLHYDALASYFKLLLALRIKISCCVKGILKICLKQHT